MSVYDIVMLIIFGGAVLFGFWKGLAWQIASLSAIIVSYIVAVNFRSQVSQFIQAEPPWNNIGAMLVLFVGTSIVIWIIYSRVSKTIKKMELKGFDRQAGALLGAVKGVLLCMIVTVLSVTWLGETAHETIHDSKFGPYIVSGIGAVSAVVPPEISQYIEGPVSEFKKDIGHDLDMGGGQNSPWPSGHGSHEEANDQKTEQPAAFRGELQWESSGTPVRGPYDAQQASFYGSDNPSGADSGYSRARNLLESVSDRVIEKIADGAKFAVPSERNQ